MTHQHTDWLNRHDYTKEERERICIELLGEAQYWDTSRYVLHMNDKTKRPWVGLKEEEQSFVYDQVKQIVDSKPFWVRFADAIEAKLKDKNHEHRG
jgi:hypothetical protein